MYYVKGQKYPTVFEIYETFFDNGFNGRAAFLTGNGYAVFHRSVNLVVGRPGEAWTKGVTAAANRLIEMGVADPEPRRARDQLRRLRHGAADHRDRTLQGGHQHLGQGGHGELLHRQPAPRRAQHARAEKSQDRIGGTLWEYPGAISSTRRSEGGSASRRRCCASPATRTRTCRRASRARSTYALRRLGKEVEWVRYVNGAHRPPSNAEESVDFETRILGWYDKYLKPRRRKPTRSEDARRR